MLRHCCYEVRRMVDGREIELWFFSILASISKDSTPNMKVKDPTSSFQQGSYLIRSDSQIVKMTHGVMCRYS